MGLLVLLPYEEMDRLELLYYSILHNTNKEKDGEIINKRSIYHYI